MRALLLPLAFCLLPSACADRAPDPMGTGAESVRFTIWLLNLPVGPPLHLTR